MFFVANQKRQHLFMIAGRATQNIVVSSFSSNASVLAVSSIIPMPKP